LQPPLPYRTAAHRPPRFESGSEEILFRRIGENEVTAIGLCDTLAAAETDPGTDSEADHLVEMLLPELRNL
jgi:hypothetical protein